MASDEKPIAVLGALTANAAIAAVKFVAALVTGSSSMLSEGIHSVVDTGNEALLLLGVHRSKKPPDATHPYGYGLELYFWSLIVAMILFSVGGGMSIYEGILHIVEGEAPVHGSEAIWNYAVLGAALLFEGTSWTIAVRKFLPTKGDRSFWAAFRGSKDPTVYTVIAEDTAAITGIFVAFAGVLLRQLGWPVFDGVASIVIGLILAGTAVVLSIEARSLLVGESAPRELVEDLERIARADPAVADVPWLKTMQLGPDQILVTLGVAFAEDDGAVDAAEAIDRLERSLRTAHDSVRHVFVEAEAFPERGA